MEKTSMEGRRKVLPGEELGGEVFKQRGQQVQRPWGGKEPQGFPKCSFEMAFVVGQAWVQFLALARSSWMVLVG